MAAFDGVSFQTNVRIALRCLITPAGGVEHCNSKCGLHRRCVVENKSGGFGGTPPNSHVNVL